MTTAFKFLRNHYLAITALSGVVLITMGLLLFTGELDQLDIQAQEALDSLGLNIFQSSRAPGRQSRARAPGGSASHDHGVGTGGQRHARGDPSSYGDGVIVLLPVASGRSWRHPYWCRDLDQSATVELVCWWGGIRMYTERYNVQHPRKGAVVCSSGEVDPCYDERVTFSVCPIVVGWIRHVSCTCPAPSA